MFRAVVKTGRSVLAVGHKSTGMRVLHPHLYAVPQCLSRRMGTKIKASELRSGNCVDYKDRRFQVVSVHHQKTGRGQAGIQTEFRDIDSNSKVNMKLRPDETLEKLMFEKTTYAYAYTDGDAVALMDMDTFDQIDVPIEQFQKLEYMEPEMEATVTLLDGSILSVSPPERVVCEVADTPSHTGDHQGSPTNKHAILTNGIRVSVPPHIQNGDRIVVNTEDDSYVSRAE